MVGFLSDLSNKEPVFLTLVPSYKEVEVEMTNLYETKCEP
jgi:hypothetical protein